VAREQYIRAASAPVCSPMNVSIRVVFGDGLVVDMCIYLKAFSLLC
jgi:hypothetical protein